MTKGYLEVATELDFDSASVVFTETGIAHQGENIIYEVDRAMLRAGEYFARFTVRSDDDPLRFWQVAANRILRPEGRYYRVVEFQTP